MNSSLQYSADVEIYLLTNGIKLQVASCLADTFTLRNPASINPGEADLVLLVDGQEFRRRILLRNHISNDQVHVVFEELAQ